MGAGPGVGNVKNPADCDADYDIVFDAASQQMRCENPDSVPDSYTFTDLTGQALSTQVTSNTVTLTGFFGNLPVSITGDGSPEFKINSGAWSTSGTVTDGDTLQLRLTTSASNGTTSTATITIGSDVSGWSVTTQPLTSTTNSASSYWTGGAGYTSFSHSGSNISKGGTNSSMYMTTPMSSDFWFEYTVADASTASWSQAGIVAADEIGNFGNSHLPNSVSAITKVWHIHPYGNQISYGSTTVSTLGSYASGDVIRFERTSGVFTLKINGSTRYTWSQTYTGNVYLAIGGHNNGSSQFNGVKWNN